MLSDLATLATTPGRVLLATSLTAVVVAVVAVALLLRLWWRTRAPAASRGSGATTAADESPRDPLTGLLPRQAFDLAIDDAVQRCDRDGSSLSLLYVGLDGFRLVVDAYGHAAGDRLLAALSARLRETLPSSVVAARLAGEEFALLLDGGAEPALQTAATLREQLQQPFRFDRTEVAIDCSIGVASYPLHGARARLLAHAFAAMRTVQQAGGGAEALFEPTMAVSLRDQAELLRDLRHAIEQRELMLAFQPKIDARTLQVTAAEALLRWRHPTRGMVSPAVFVPLAERHGLIGAIGQWVIEESCRLAGEWRKQGLRMRVAVNLSGVQLRQDDLVDRLEEALRRHGIAPERFTCEITESVAMEDTRVTREAFERLRHAGIHVSIDDFGTGHSSLAILRRLPAAELKIDRAFVTDLETSEEARSIAETIIKMAHTLQLRVVAEGVETERQRDLLVAMGCDELQGYVFARPMSAMALAVWAHSEPTAQTLGFRPSLFQDTKPRELAAH